MDACRVGVLFGLVWVAVLAVVLLEARPALAAPPPALTPSPPALDFGSQDIHNPPATMTVNFMNMSGNSTTVSQATITGPDESSYSITPGQDSCSSQTIPDLGSCSIAVTFDASSTGPGAKTATLTVPDGAGTNDIALSGTAVTGTLSSDQSSLDFGGLVINQGSSNQQHVTISDNLVASVNISNVQIIGPDASSFYVQNNGCPGTLQPGNTCQIYVQFQPNSAGTQTAQLQINNDGNTDPLVVSLTGDGLTGPAVTISPAQAIYGNVPLGSEASRTFTLTNDGDAPLQIGAMFLAAGSPQVFPISDNNCLDRQIAPSDSCRFAVGFIPIALGDKDGSLFVITNASNPGVTTIGLDGVGVAQTGAPPDGTVTIVGAARAGNRLTCSPHSYPSGTRFSYRWLRNRKAIPGALGKRHLLGDADVGTRLACRVTATDPGGSQTVTSRATAPTLAQLTIDTTGVSGDTITATVTSSRGKLHAVGRIAHSRAPFAKQTITVRRGGTFTIGLSPNVGAHRALTSGRALHVKEILVLKARHARKPIRRAFRVIVGANVHAQR